MPPASRGPEQPPRGVNRAPAAVTAALDAVSEGYILLDREWRFVYANPAAEGFMRQARTDVLGKTLWECFPEAVDRRFGLEYRRAVAENVPVQFQEFYPEPLNAWFEVRAYPSSDGLSIFFRDVTEHRRLEEALRVNLTKYSVLFDTFPLGISVTDAAGQVREINRRASLLLGTTPAEIVGQKVGTPRWRIIRPDGSMMPPEELASVRAMRERRVVEDVETGIARPGQDVIWVSVTAAPIPLEGYGVVITFGDISRRKRAEAGLADTHRQTLAAQARLEAAMEAIPVGLAILDASGGLVRANAAFERIWGSGRPHVSGVDDNRHFRARWVDTGREVHPDEWASARAVRTGEPVVGQLLEIDRFDGGRAIVLNSAAPIVDEHQTVSGCAVAIQDVSRLVDVERALARSQSALEAVNAQLEAANAELRAINESLEARVAERTADLAQRASQIEALALDRTRAEERERQRIARVVHDHLQQLLSLSRINLGIALKRVTDRTLRQALRGVDALVGESLDITRSISSDLSPAIVHRSTLGAVVHWLGRWFGNRFGLRVEVDADEAMDVDEETRVTLFRATRELLFNVVKHARVTQASMRLERSGDGRLQVVVRDDGAGFDPAILRAWDGARGTFGLLSLREHLELIGGRLDVESAPGLGTTATIVGPLPRPTPERLPDEQPAGVPAVPPVTASPDARPPEMQAPPPARRPRATGLARARKASHPVRTQGQPRATRSTAAARRSNKRQR